MSAPPIPDHPFRLSFSRIVNASADALYRGWTDEKLILKWFTPKPWKTVAAKIEPYPGGAFNIQMQSPEGETMPMSEGCVLLARPGECLITTGLLARGFIPQEIPKESFGFVIRLYFSREGEGARYEAIVDHVDEAGMKQHEAMGFEAGWNKALDQLVELVGHS